MRRTSCHYEPPSVPTGDGNGSAGSVPSSTRATPPPTPIWGILRRAAVTASRPTAAMYNGVGLQTPRGSGTSGHVQASKFLLAKPRPSPSSSAASVDAGGGTRKPNKDILEHDRKRQVELRLLVLRDALEEQGYTKAEIEARKAAEAEAAAEGVEEEGPPPLQCKGFMDTRSHHAAGRKEKQLQTMRSALGLDAKDLEKKDEL